MITFEHLTGVDFFTKQLNTVGTDNQPRSSEWSLLQDSTNGNFNLPLMH